MHIVEVSVCVKYYNNGSAVGDKKRERHNYVYVENCDFVLVITKPEGVVGRNE